MTESERLQILERAFSPSAPIKSQDLFAGRFKQVERVCDAINEKGQHFVIFGDRGVGKTSLANIIDTKLINVTVAKVTCNRSETFKQIWEKALQKIRFVRERRGAGFHPEKLQESTQIELFPSSKTEITSIDIQNTLEKVGSNLLFLFDEFDSVSSHEIQISFSDTIKALSDNAPNVTVGIVGIAENVDELIGKHASLERCVKQVEMPRMSRTELGEIIRKGLALLQMTAGLDVRSEILNFSSGFPHFTHLLAKFAAKHAIMKKVSAIKQHHLEGAIADALENANQSIKTGYTRATLANKPQSKFASVISACAIADEDENGTFSPKDLIGPYYKLTNRRVDAQDLAYTLQKLCESDRGRALQKVDAIANIRYRFASPLMKTYAKLKLHQKGTSSGASRPSI